MVKMLGRTRSFFGRGFCSHALEEHKAADFTVQSARGYGAIDDWWMEVDELESELEEHEGELKHIIFDSETAQVRIQSKSAPPTSAAVPVLNIGEEELDDVLLDLFAMQRAANKLSFAMGHVASAWETHVDRWVKFIGNKNVTMDKLTLGLTSRSAMTTLKDLASRFGDDADVQEAVAAAGDDAMQFFNALCRDSSSACGREVRAYLCNYYWMAESDEDMSSEHWGDNPTVPLNILLQLMKPAAAARQPSSSAPSPLPRSSIAPPPPSTHPPPEAPSEQGEQHNDGQGHQHTPVARQSSADVELEESMANARAVVGDEEGFWRDLGHLRRFLLAKEKIHVCYVKIGFLLKHLLLERSRRWIQTKWLSPTQASFQSYARSSSSTASTTAAAATPAAAAASPSSSGTVALPEQAIFSAPALHLISALSGKMNGSELAQRIDIASYERVAWRNYKPKYWAGGYERGSISENANSQAAATASLNTSADGNSQRAAVGQRIQGFPCSPGRGGGGGTVTGPCRVITSLADQAKDVRAGEILVAEYTSPAWTPLFSLVVAVVLEHGGMLSHGAVVARECGIPAVSQVADATAGFATGDILSVDGVTGVVTVVLIAEK